MKKLAIFDLDGTLVNSLYDLADSVNIVLERYGFAVHQTQEYKRFVGNGTLKLIERALPEDKRTDQTITLLHSEFSEQYHKRAILKTRPYEGIPDLLETLKERGITLAVASNKPDEFSAFIVKSLFGDSCFDLVVGKREGTAAKPAPDILFSIMDFFKMDKRDTLMIGDSDVDVITAHNAGVECVGCCWGFRGRAELLSAGADYLAKSPKEIAEFLNLEDKK